MSGRASRLFFGGTMKFRPCIDLHQGKVKQIVGSTLDEGRPDSLKTNFVAERPASWFAGLYRADQLAGGHIIKLGPGNDEAAIAALSAWPGGLQIGGGITAENAAFWLAQGASHVIVTSHVFTDGMINRDRLADLVRRIGKERLVLDLSCRRKGEMYYIVTDRWQKFTEVAITAEVLDDLSRSCAEFLIHAADVEGKCAGMEVELIELLGRLSPVPTTYAGGIRHLEDLFVLRDKGGGRLDFTVGSALDIFGGTSMTYREAVAFGR